MKHSSCPSAADIMPADDDDLPPAECEAIRAHLASCPACRQRREEANTVFEAIDAL